MSATYPLCSDNHGGVPSTWLEKFQAIECSGLNALIHRCWGPSTTIYYSFKENKRKTKGKLSKVSYIEIFQTVKCQDALQEGSRAEQLSKYAADTSESLSRLDEGISDLGVLGGSAVALTQSSITQRGSLCANAQPCIGVRYTFG
nr:hypothetical protein [Comamonas koreensis]